MKPYFTKRLNFKQIWWNQSSENANTDTAMEFEIPLLLQF